MISYKHLICAGFGLLLLSGCGTVRDQLGLEKESPDEFAVITRAPLEFPDRMVLVKPQPGLQRPQEKQTIEAAKEAVFGSVVTAAGSDRTKRKSDAEHVLLKRAGADDAVKDIRSLVNQETAELEDRNKPVVEKLIGLGSDKTVPSATVVDPTAEFERIKKAQQGGETITGDGSAMVEQ